MSAQRALDALSSIRGDYELAAETSDGGIIVYPYWAPEVVDPDGRPIGTAQKHVDQWERIVDTLSGAGFEPYQPHESSPQRMGRLFAALGGRLHEGQPVLFRPKSVAAEVAP